MSRSEIRAARLLREMRVSFVLALPLVLSQLSSMGMNIVDTLLAGRHGPVTLAAVGVGSAIWSVVILVSIGVLMAVPPTVSQLNGAGRRGEIGPVFRQALWLALALGVALVFVVRAGALALGPMGITPEARPEAVAFLRAISWGAPGLALFFCLRNLSEGVAWTVPSMVVGAVGLALLAPLGYGLMFGAGLGAAGLGYAVAIVLWCQAASMATYLWRARRFADLRLFERFEGPRWPPIRALLRLGLPMGVSVFMEGSLFVATALLIGTLGTTQMAAHQIAILIASLCFMVPLGVAMATTVRVGHAVGAGDLSGVRWAAGAGYALAMLAQTASAVLLVTSAAWLAALFTADPAVIALASLLMAYAAVFQYPDGLQALSAGALRGMKDTRVPMVITVLAYWGLGLPLGAWLGLARGQGAPGLWTGLILGLAVAASLLGWRFWRLSRRPLPAVSVT
ncbi:MAG: MATE family efflux transporter [Arenimonas sp. SCN 70-307]|uniref:MATE family efflux transporter n=1 Tax=Arenimonas sp. SCN 70-307 TaxID=1660089 RepID=UPI00086CA2E6|nr:MATE family efflux transporter [Arenimonas sp. SCN 70-307]ODS63918.1 MAG: MATE family efflux transporter [Arenimonas sp. SCN 70-307]